MRKLASAIAIGLLVSGAATTVTPQNAVAAVAATKVVIVVGATQGATSTYRSDADAAAAVFAKYNTAEHRVSITKIYSPNATWSAVQGAARGANIVVYMGHGSGFPNPYVGYLQPNGDNGMGLNTPTGGSDSVTKYYGENYMAQLSLAPNAVVILNHLCYASGDNEAGTGLPSIGVVHTRVDGYASGFLRAGAKAVIADGLRDIGPYIDGLFSGHTTIDALWKSPAVGYHGNLQSWASSRSTGFTSQIDPDQAHPQRDGDYYYRSMVANPSLKTDDVVSGQMPVFVAQTGTYHPIDAVRVVDTRGNGIGPAGSLTSGGRYSFDIAGSGAVPTGAMAITANLTVTNQSAPGWVFVGPAITSAPESSTINFPVKDDRANGMTVALSTQGTLDAWFGATTGAKVDIIIDVTGYYTPDTSGDGYVQYGPKRLVDTRYATGLSGRFLSGKPRTVQIAGVQGLPASGITAVVGNITIVHPSERGLLYAGPTASAPPSRSTINFPVNEIRANNFTIKVAPDGTIGVVFMGADAAGTSDVIVDISGYYVKGTGAQFHSLAPYRTLDSRRPVGIAGPIPGLSPKTLTVVGTGGVQSGAIGITANLTVTQQTQLGYAAIGPTISSSPFSNLNFPLADDRANGVSVPLASNGTVQLVVGVDSSKRAQLILDVNGYFQ